MKPRLTFRAIPCLLLLPGLLVVANASAAPEVYQLDPVHTRIMFAVEHAGFSQAIGTVSGSSGRLTFDPDDWSASRLDVSVPLQHVDLGDAKWNDSVLAGNLLDVANFPTATFVSTRVEPVDARHATVHGNLTLRGVTREVALDVVFNALERHPLPPFRRTAGFSATTVISRADFGIDAWKSVIGDRVELRMEVEATRTRQDGKDTRDGVPTEAPAPDAATEPTTP